MRGDNGCGTCTGCGCFLLWSFVIIPAIVSGAPLLLVPLIAGLWFILFLRNKLSDWVNGEKR